jgi:hypothetical protein
MGLNHGPISASLCWILPFYSRFAALFAALASWLPSEPGGDRARAQASLRARMGGRAGGDSETARRPEKRAAAEVCEKGKMPFDGDDNAKYEERQDYCR